MMHRFLAAAAAGLLALPVYALSTDRDQPIEVHADQFNGDEVHQTAIYTGNVTVDQGSMNLRGARLELRITPKGYRRITVTGAPARFKQKRDPDPKRPNVDEWAHAEALTIIYDEETDTVILQQRAKISRTENGAQKDMTQGEKIVYDMRFARSSVDGGVVNGKKQRVTTIIAPRNNSKNAPKRSGAELSSSPALSSGH